MPNQLYNQLQTQQPYYQNANNLTGLINLMKSTNNPKALISSLLEQNPQFKQIAPLLTNGSPKQVFFEQAMKMGVDPNQIINRLTN